MAAIDVVQFEISGTNYAIDIKTAQEIVEMMPITPVPRSPPHIAGIINLRGEITNVMNLNCLMGLDSGKEHESKKIIVLVPEATGGSNIGLIVDDVQSVLQIDDKNVDQMDASLSKEAFVKGIIKTGGNNVSKQDLVIWIDIEKILEETLGKGSI
ncbi:MAG: chemotaxis protein CheW [Methanomicrobium sp.]|nr:chemotaxis protein CheW [Methanomicrobium sp.]